MPGPRSSSSASGGTSRSRGDARDARRADARAARRGAGRRREDGRGRAGVSDAGRAPRRRDGPRGGPSASPEATMSNTSSRATQQLFAAPRVVTEDRRGRTPRGARDTRRRVDARGAPSALARSPAHSARAHARRSSARASLGPGGASRACHRRQLTRVRPMRARSVGSRSDTHADRVGSSRHRPPRGTIHRPAPRGATRRRARTRTHGMSLLTREPPPLDDASRRARAPSRRAADRLGQSQAAQEQRGPIDRPRRDGDRDRDSVCVLPPRPPSWPTTPPARPPPARRRRRRWPSPPSLALGCPRLVLRHHLLDARHRRHRARGDALRPRRAPVRHLRLDRRPPPRRRPPPAFGPDDIASHFAVAVAAAAAVTAARAALLRAWPDSRASGGSIQPTGAPALNRSPTSSRYVSFRPSRRRRFSRVRSEPALRCGPVGVAATTGGVRGVAWAAERN